VGPLQRLRERYDFLYFLFPYLGCFVLVPQYFPSGLLALKINGTMLLLLHNITVLHPEVTEEPLFSRARIIACKEKLKLQCANSHLFSSPVFTFLPEGHNLGF